MGFFRRIASGIGYLFSQKWLTTLIGCLAVAFLIWFGGPLLAIAGKEPFKSEMVRMYCLIGIAVLWGIINIRHLSKAKKQDKETVEKLLDTSEEEDDLQSEATTHEINTIRERIQTATQLLNKTKKRGRKSVYSLPWYVMIGPPGTGKTTTLANSGLEFPLQESLGDQPLAGIGGTRHCDWWFTNKAVLIDTAGRYTTQDSQANADSKAWFGFLGLLKQYRTKRPINGAIVTISLVSLMTQTKTERNLHARAIKMRIQELRNQLGMHFPVYVVLTKADLVAGFSEFFAEMEPEKRDQPWGMMFPLECDHEKGVVSLFNKEFHRLLTELLSHMPVRLQGERDMDNRSLVYEFPKQLRMLQSQIDDFLKEVFAANAFEAPPMLRGVFIVSAAQEGKPIDRVMAETSGGLGLSQIPLRSASGSQEGFFIRDLFEKIIFPEQYLGSVNQHHAKQNRWIHRAALFGGLLVAGGMSAAWYYSFDWNKGLVHAAELAVDDYQATLGGQPLSGDLDAVTLVRALDQLRGLPAGYDKTYLDTSGIKKIGLYQGDKIGQSASQAYSNGLKTAMSSFANDALTSEMATHREHREYLYETLKTYLMLFDPTHYDSTQVLTWFEAYFERTYPGEINIELRESLMSHIENMLTTNNVGIQPDTKAIEMARGELTKMPIDERAYQRMKLEFMDSHIPSFRVTDVLGSRSLNEFERLSGKPLSMGIPGFYTYNGFHGLFQLEINRMVRRLMEDNWVYGDEIDLSRQDASDVVEAVRQRYFRDYNHEWDQLVSDLVLKRAKGLDASLAQAKILAGPEQPIQNLIRAYQRQLRLTQIEVSKNVEIAGEVASNVADVALHSQKTRYGRLLPSESPELNLNLAGKEVEYAFHELLAISDIELNHLTATFSAYHNYLVDLSSASSSDRVAYKSMLDGKTHRALSGSFRKADNMLPMPFRSWVSNMSVESDRVAQQGASVHLNQIWQNTVYAEYQKTIANRYPFNPSAKEEVKLSDFQAFFGYGGTMDKFFKQYLDPVVDTSKGTWRFEKSIGVSNQSLAFFERAHRIRRAFFEPGSNNIRVEFGLKPQYLDQHVRSIKIELGNQSMNYGHGPTRRHNFVWPDRNPRTRVVFTPFESGSDITRTYGSQWGLFRLLDQALAARPQARKDNVIVIDIRGTKSKLELIPGSAVNPFWSREMERFVCPKTL
ncbi:type VI secretion system membrane subunit TssM [Thaumasiovibrio subtropicus]|uniref:type VI secretion system membrane subunit TssM n=1 Tax=Thaumasiovibrio subtropicus TaxID=1891207 RepID=UPI000B35FB4D|nr:type VI secretion system membrane subunit TssM [Thaumasiovibrio subtropicus]